jgi:hypothetical protein
VSALRLSWLDSWRAVMAYSSFGDTSKWHREEGGRVDLHLHELTSSKRSIMFTGLPPLKTLIYPPLKTRTVRTLTSPQLAITA